MNSNIFPLAWIHITNEKNPVNMYEIYVPPRYLVPSIIHIAQRTPDKLAKIDFFNPLNFPPDAK